jgi:ABC-2 type transport system ATP-binding protein
VALDTPDNLKQTFVPDQVIVARGRDLARATSSFGALQGVHAVAPFGAGLHLRVDPGVWSEARIIEALTQAGAADVTVQGTEPTLEDVFLTVVGANGATSERPA